MDLESQFLIVSVNFKIGTSLCDLRHALKESQLTTQSQHPDCDCGAFWSQADISRVKLPLQKVIIIQRAQEILHSDIFPWNSMLNTTLHLNGGIWKCVVFIKCQPSRVLKMCIFLLVFKNTSAATCSLECNITEDINRSDQLPSYSAPFPHPNTELIYACDWKMFLQGLK